MWLWRFLDRFLAFCPFGLSVAALLMLLTQNPLSAPYVERSLDDVRIELAAALAREVTPEWYETELEAALAARDLDRVRLVAMTGGRHGLAPDDQTLSRMQDLETEETGALAAMRDCAVCAADITACPRVALLAMCGVSVEMTPLGDLNALRRAAQAGIAGDEVDGVEVALASVGLGATGLALASGGTSVTVKVGATALRLARKMGRITESFATELRQMADIGFKPGRLDDYALGKVEIGEVVDSARLGRAGDLAYDLGRVAANTSLTDAVLMLDKVDDAADAHRLARLSDAAGPETRSTLELLGKSRAFRALVRLSGLAIGAAALLWLVGAQVLMFLGERIGRMLFGLVRAPVRRRAQVETKTAADAVRPEPPLTRPRPQLRPDPPLRRPVASAAVLGHTPAR